MTGLFQQPATVPDRRRHRFLLPRPVFHRSLSLSQVNKYFAISLITFLSFSESKIVFKRHKAARRSYVPGA